MEKSRTDPIKLAMITFKFVLILVLITATDIHCFMNKFNGLPRLMNHFSAISEGKKSSDWLLEEATNEIQPSSLYKSDCITYGVSLALAEEYMILNENMDDALELAQMSLKAAGK